MNRYTKNILSAALLFAFASALPAQALTLAAMKQTGSAIKWRESDRDLRTRDMEEYVMNVKVPSGDIEFAAIESCMYSKLAPFANIQPMDKKGPSFHELMGACVN